jgi:alanine transaminase
MLTRDKLNPNLLAAQYAVRGPIVHRAQVLEEQGRKIIYCNIGNPQGLKQRPLTFIRQMLSLLEYPDLLHRADARKLFPRDVLSRAEQILANHPPGTGAYSQSQGIPFIREAVADFIRRRDRIAADRDHVILTDGASKGAQAVITALLRQRGDGFMIPIPQYPLYSASLALYGGTAIGYYLDEQRGWELNDRILEESLSAARREGRNPVAIVVINPGNPTGAVLSEENIRMIIGFAREHRLSIIADEVYQENVYDPHLRFHSIARVMVAMKETQVSLFSLHSVSKGFLGECGHRGGYVELRNIPDDVLAEFVKLQSISLCANLPGQFATYLMVSPPGPGEESYETFVRERDEILAELKEKARILGEGIGKIEGLSVVIPRGAMYAFVKLELPETDDISRMTPAERIAYEEDRDTKYCLALLEETGICVVPGSGFGQMPGTLHFRTTFLPPREEIEHLVTSLGKFHLRYIRELAEA